MEKLVLIILTLGFEQIKWTDRVTCQKWNGGRNPQLWHWFIE